MGILNLKTLSYVQQPITYFFIEIIIQKKLNRRMEVIKLF